MSANKSPLTELLKSGKFWTGLIMVIVSAAAVFGLDLDQDALLQIVALILGLGGGGLAGYAVREKRP